MLQQEISEYLEKGKGSVLVGGLVSYYETREEFRWNFIEKYGFSIIDNDFVIELVDKLMDNHIQTFTEVYAGNGTLTRVLLENGFDGVGYTLPVKDDIEGYGFVEDNPVRKQLLKDKKLIYKDISALDKIDSDLLVMSWVPLDGGSEIVELSSKGELPEYVLLIGYVNDVVTGSFDFHDWLDETYETIHEFGSFKSFIGVQDTARLMKRRKNVS